MLLTVDVGNTNTVLGVYDRDDLKFISRFSTSKNATGDEFAVTIKAMLYLHGISEKSITGSIISSVVPQITDCLASALTFLFGTSPIIVGPGIKTGLNIKIDNPAQLGADLLVDSVAASVKYPKPCIVIDMGTATTLTVVNEKNEFLGGAIMPGLGISLDALSSRTSQLPGIALAKPHRTIGRNTIECMQSGLVLGCASMLDGMIERFENELGQKCFVVATGGLAPVITSLATHDITFDDNLLLDGLKILYENNVSKKGSDLK